VALASQQTTSMARPARAALSSSMAALAILAAWRHGRRHCNAERARVDGQEKFNGVSICVSVVGDKGAGHGAVQFVGSAVVLPHAVRAVILPPRLV
jgi:hypothetical protein